MNSDAFRRIMPSCWTEFGCREEGVTMSKFKERVKEAIREDSSWYAKINNDVGNLDQYCREIFNSLEFIEGRTIIRNGYLYLNKDYKIGKIGFLAIHS